MYPSASTLLALATLIAALGSAVPVPIPPAATKELAQAAKPATQAVGREVSNVAKPLLERLTTSLKSSSLGQKLSPVVSSIKEKVGGLLHRSPTSASSKPSIGTNSPAHSSNDSLHSSTPPHDTSSTGHSTSPEPVHGQQVQREATLPPSPPPMPVQKGPGLVSQIATGAAVMAGTQVVTDKGTEALHAVENKAVDMGQMKPTDKHPGTAAAKVAAASSTATTPTAPPAATTSPASTTTAPTPQPQTAPPPQGVTQQPYPNQYDTNSSMYNSSLNSMSPPMVAATA